MLLVPYTPLGSDHRSISGNSLSAVRSRTYQAHQVAPRATDLRGQHIGKRLQAPCPGALRWAAVVDRRQGGRACTSAVGWSSLLGTLHLMQVAHNRGDQRLQEQPVWYSTPVSPALFSVEGGRRNPVHRLHQRGKERFLRYRRGCLRIDTAVAALRPGLNAAQDL